MKRRIEAGDVILLKNTYIFLCSDHLGFSGKTLFKWRVYANRSMR